MKSIAKTIGDENSQDQSDKQFVAPPSFEGSGQAHDSAEKVNPCEGCTGNCSGEHKDNCAENF